jgi:hypothetical protein
MVSSTNKTDRHYIPEILLKVALNTQKTTNPLIILRQFFLVHMHYCLFMYNYDNVVWY